MSFNQLIGIFGGTFDPIHNGHLKSIESLLNELDFCAIHLIPSAMPPHRDPAHASALHRFNMLKLAIKQQPKLIANDLECQREGLSYSIDTFKRFRLDYPCKALAFIVGADAFETIRQWKNWRDYLNYVHLLVMPRPGYQQSQQGWWTKKQVYEPEQLNQHLYGKVYFANCRQVDLSSTQIRQMIRCRDDLSAHLPEPVINYINEYKLYTT